MVLVTGATGILGRVLVLELLKQGKSVRATKREMSNLQEVKKSWNFYTSQADEYFKKIEWVEVDFEDLDSLRIALEGIEEVYHCSAKVSFYPKDEAEMFKTNIEGTKNLLYIAEEKSVKKFLFVSSIAVFDKINEKGEIDEESDFDGKKQNSAYALSKYLSEMEVWRAYAEGMNTIIINPGVIIGSGNWGKSSGDLFPSFEKSPFSFSGGTAYVDVRDVAKIAVVLMEKEKFGERYIIISENKKYKEVADKIRQFLGKNESVILPKFWLNLGYGLNLALGWLFPYLRIISKENIKMLTEFTPISNKKIIKELNFQFISVKDSLDFHLKNYKNTFSKRN